MGARRFSPPLRGARSAAAAAVGACLALASFAARADGGFSLVPRSLQKNPPANVSVITEFTANGKKAPAASPDHPQYFIGHDVGLTQAGDVNAGERSPSFAVLSGALQRALAVNGYLPADQAHPPTLFIAYRWGSFNYLNVPLTPEPAALSGGAPPSYAPGSADFDDVQLQNIVERAAIVGGQKFGVELARALSTRLLDQFSERDAKTRQLVDMVMGNDLGDLYFVIASTYDLASVRQGHATLLWRTKMSTNSQGLTMDETLPLLVAGAAPYFGRDMPESVQFIRRIQEGRVEVGEPTVKGYAEPADSGGK